MTKSEMRAALESIRIDADKAMLGGKVRAAMLLPFILSRFFGLVLSIINSLPEG